MTPFCSFVITALIYLFLYMYVYAHQPGYLLARSAGDAEAVLEHVQPFFYECVPSFLVA